MQADRRRDQYQAGGHRQPGILQRIQRVVDRQRCAGRVTDDMDRPVADPVREVSHRNGDDGGHILPAHTGQPGRGRPMTRQAQAQDLETLFVQCPGQGTKGVRGIGQPVQQEHGPDGRVGTELEAAIPVRCAHARIGCTAGTVTLERVLRAGRDLGIDLLLQLGKQLVFQPKIVLEALYLAGSFLCEFRLQLFGMPGLERGAATTADEQQRDDTEHPYGQGSGRRMSQCPDRLVHTDTPVLVNDHVSAPSRRRPPAS